MTVIAAVITGVLFFVGAIIGWVIKDILDKNRLATAKLQAERILKDAESEADAKVKDALLKANSGSLCVSIIVSC